MHKFFVKEENLNIETNEIHIVGSDVNHIKNVLRCKIGEEILVSVLLEKPHNYCCVISKMDSEKVICTIKQEIETSTEPNIYVHIIQGLPKSDKMELVIEKAVELGGAEITPVEMKRSIVKLGTQEKMKKQERWQKISQSASKQAKRDVICKINPIISIKNIFEILQEYDIVLVAYENETKNFLANEIALLKEGKYAKIAIIIGPEGGIEEEEIDFLKRNGAKIISLGNRILRTETVAITILSIVMYELGDLGRK